MRRSRLPIVALLLAGWGPFQCSDPTVDDANALIRQGKGAEALEALKALDADRPEVHFARGLAHVLNEQPDEARTALDNAYRLTAEALTDGSAKDADREARLLDLKRRISFARGQAAVAKEDWKAAYEEFANALRLDPSDEAARWNTELAWFKLHPPCNMRDDDHEPDDPRADAKPFDPQKADKRLLCPADEDWYAIEAPHGAFLYVNVEGKVDTEDGETRQVTLELYGPEEGGEALRSAPLEKGKATVGISGLPSGGAWKVRVAGPGRAEVTYKIGVELVLPCPSDDEKEENDAPEAATAAQDGELPGLKSCPGDADWFRVTVPKGEGREIQVRHDPSRGKLAAALFDADGVTPLAAPEGAALKVEQGDEERTVLVQVNTAEHQENTYTLVVKKSDEDEKDDEKSEDEKKDDQQDQQQDQDEQQQQDQQQPQPQPQAQQDQVDIEKLVESLDKHQKNPQLEKMLRGLPAYPQMEDY